MCLKSLVNYEKDKKYSIIELSGAVDRYNFNNNDFYSPVTPLM